MAARLSLVPVTQSLPLAHSSARVKIKAGDRWILMGTSGSGKTTALKYLDAAYTRLFPTARHYVLDSKMDGDFDDWPGVIVSDRAPPRPKSDARYQVWQCIQINPEEIERWLFQVRKDPPAILEIDELHTLVYKRDVYSPEYNIILKTGRSAPVGSIALTQELSKIPQNAYKQASHRLGFYIDKASRYDRQIWQALLKHPVEDPPDEFGLYYQHQNGRAQPLYFPTVQDFLGIR